MDRNYNLDHIPLPNGKDEVYVASGAPRNKDYPSRDRERHAEKLKAELEEVIDEFERQVEKYENREAGLVTLEGKEGYNLKGESAANKLTGSEVLKKDEDTETKKAVVRITESGFENVSKKMEQYKTEETKRGKPRNKNFVESVEKIKATILEELWMGEEDEWPVNEQEQKWWELWLIGGELDEDKSRRP